MNRSSLLPAAAGLIAMLLAAGGPIVAAERNQEQEVRTVPAAVNVTPPAGERYQAEVPDTLDLAARAEIALNALTGALDPAYNYEIYFGVDFHSHPPVMRHEVSGLPTNNPKFAESLPMMRVMSGSDAHLDIERGMMAALAASIGPDGLYYARAKGRPWHRNDPAWNPANEDFANVYGNGRALLAMMAWYQRDRDPAWAARLDKMADALARIAWQKDNYTFFPDARVGESFSFPISGWTPATVESKDYNFGVFMYHSGVLRALARWYEMRKRPQDLEMARRLARYLRQPGMWGVVDPARRASFGGHFHARVAALRGLAEYAIAAHDAETLQFAREGYEYARSVGVPSIGWFPEFVGGPFCETCCIADMVGLAVQLSDVARSDFVGPPSRPRRSRGLGTGAGDYWDDVDAYVRNQLTEQQFLRADVLEKVSQDGPARPTIDTPRESADRVIERNLGGFAGHGNPTSLPNAWIMHCCTGNGTQALYYAWEGIVRAKGDTAEVNLLLNRTSPWVDVDSYLPYEGKAVFHVKTAKRLSVRLPAGVAADQVCGSRNGKAILPKANGRRLVFEGLAPGQTLTIEFPMPQRTETFTVADKEYRAKFRSGALVWISPREESAGGYPIYLRDNLRARQAPMKTVTRYVSPVQIRG